MRVFSKTAVISLRSSENAGLGSKKKTANKTKLYGRQIVALKNGHISLSLIEIHLVRGSRENWLIPEMCGYITL